VFFFVADHVLTSKKNFQEHCDDFITVENKII